MYNKREIELKYISPDKIENILPLIESFSISYGTVKVVWDALSEKYKIYVPKDGKLTDTVNGYEELKGWLRGAIATAHQLKALSPDERRDRFLKFEKYHNERK